jgi:hypothetical protein
MHSTRLIPVEGHNSFSRDPKTGAILNTNKSQYEKYVATRNKLRSDEEKLNKTAEQVEELKKDVGEIKDMLLQLISGINTK